MSGILLTLAVVLLVIVIVQIAKATELMGVLRGKEQELETNKRQAFFMAVTGVFLFVFSFATTFAYKDKLLPVAASEQGVWIDKLIVVTLFFTGIVFVITQALLFIFAYKYQYRKDRKAFYFPHNNSMEFIWTVVPAAVLTVLVVMGLDRWFKIYSKTPEDAVVIEATAQQFKWNIRYPGKDLELGPRDFTLVSSTNELGVNWNHKASQDDFIADSIVLPVNTPVLVKIGALDVLHNFYLPHFRMKMDAVPGIPTQFWFRPTITTDSMRLITNNPQFNYELACAELCGSAHYNMRKLVKVVSKEKYEEWANTQPSFYDLVIRPNLSEEEGSGTEEATEEPATTEEAEMTAELTTGE